MPCRRIKQLRIEKSCSLARLSRKTGIPKTYLLFIERQAKQLPPIFILAKIAEVLDISISDLIGDYQRNIKIEQLHSISDDYTKKDEVRFSNFNSFKYWLEHGDY